MTVVFDKISVAMFLMHKLNPLSIIITNYYFNYQKFINMDMNYFKEIPANLCLNMPTVFGISVKQYDVVVFTS